MTATDARRFVHKFIKPLTNADLQSLPISPTRAQLVEWLTKHSPPLTSQQIQDALKEFDKT